jgi:hypothetical protein
MLESRFIKNTENALLSLDKVLDDCGTGKEIARMIDDLLFCCLLDWCNENNCLGAYHWNIISTAKEVREMFYKIE